MNDLMKAYSAIGAGVLVAFVLSYPLQSGLNQLAKHICQNNDQRHLVKYTDPVFPGQVKEACVPHS
jgi:hypothetical protein